MLLPITESAVIPRSQIVDVLSGFCQEWQEVVGDESLIDIQASVGLILGDLVLAFGLSSQEQIAVLGDQLRKEFFRTVRSNQNS